MNDFKAEIVRIDRIEKHPNADRLELAYVRGWQVVVQKGGLKSGDMAVYIPIDAVLPADLEQELFPEGSKIKLTKSRIRTIKIRGAVSQGMLIPARDPAMCLLEADIVEGEDITAFLGITKYEPPTREIPQGMQGKKVRKSNPFFVEYAKMSHFKNYPDLFTNGEEVVVTEKIHGTNFRAGWVPTVADTWWKKVKKFFGQLSEWEFVCGSHHVQLQNKKTWDGFYNSNVYAETVARYGLPSQLPKGYVVYGEIYGPGIQKGYDYGVPSGEHRLAIFDVLVTMNSGVQTFLDWGSVEAYCSLFGLRHVPVIYKGPFQADMVPVWESGPSLLGWYPGDPIINNEPAQAHREGCVVKPMQETQSWIGRKMLRSINPDYSMLPAEEVSEFH